MRKKNREMTDKLLYDPESAAAVLSVSRATVYIYLANGELESIRMGRSRRIPREALERFVEQRRQPSEPVAA